MTPVNIPGAIICLICAGLMLLVVAYFGHQLWFILAGKPMRSIPRSWDFIPMSSDLQTIDAQLRAQGFEPLGLLERLTSLNSTVFYTWVYVNEERTILVETSQVDLANSPMVKYSTTFEDDAMIITRFPIGEAIERDMLNNRFAKNLESAYKYHLQMVKEWRSIHGHIFKTEMLEQVNDLYLTYYKNYRWLDLRRFSYEAMITVAMAFVVIVMLLLDTALLTSPAPMPPTRLWSTQFSVSPS
jgi:hypothetical protein